jgi:predicted protein tyrosine phosphatase
MGEEKSCFVIGPIGEPGSGTRKRSDQLLKHVITPVVEPRGYKTVRGDNIPEPGMITPQIIDRVRDSDLVVADLAGTNPNVFYELAIRHAERTPLIQIMAEGEEIPFDVQDMRTISLNINDLDSADEARQELSKQLDVIEAGDFQMNTPISMAMDLRALRESADPGQRVAASVLDAVADLKAQLVHQQNRMSRLQRTVDLLRALHGDPRVPHLPSVASEYRDMPTWLMDLRHEVAHSPVPGSTQDEELPAWLRALTDELRQSDGAPNPDS